MQGVRQPLTARGRLAPQATQLHRALIGAMAFVGTDELGPGVPDYNVWKRDALEPQVRRLRQAVASIFAQFTTAHDFGAAVEHFATRVFEAATCGEQRLLCTAVEFERDIGSLDPLRETLEVPPYAQIVLQGAFGAGIRHPEWHLAGDVAYLLSLYRGALATEKTEPSKIASAIDPEAGQTLARATVVACFNLLESFAIGLAHAHAMTTDLDAGMRNKLLDTRAPLQKRILEVPDRIIATQAAGDVARAPVDVVAFDFIFTTAKKYRDAFVHPEPGRETSKRGYAREDFFHTEDAEPIVEATTENTVKLISSIWRRLHRRDGPRWLSRMVRAVREGSAK